MASTPIQGLFLAKPRWKTFSPFVLVASLVVPKVTISRPCWPVNWLQEVFKLVIWKVGLPLVLEKLGADKLRTHLNDGHDKQWAAIKNLANLAKTRLITPQELQQFQKRKKTSKETFESGSESVAASSGSTASTAKSVPRTKDHAWFLHYQTWCVALLLYVWPCGIVLCWGLWETSVRGDNNAHKWGLKVYPFVANLRRSISNFGCRYYPHFGFACPYGTS